MKIDEFLSTTNFSEKEKEGIRGIFNAMSEESKLAFEERAKELATRSDIEGLKTAIKEIEDSMAQRSHNDEPQDDAFKASLRAYFNDIKEKKNDVRFSPVSVRAASVMTLAGQSPNYGVGIKIDYDTRVHSAPSTKDSLSLRLNKGATSTAITRYVQLNGKEGTAEVVAEGALKPLMSFSYVDAQAVTQKLAVKIKVTDEFEDFTEFFEDVRTRARRELLNVVENEVAVGNGSAGHLQGIAVANGGASYSDTSLNGTVTAPNLVDVILAMAKQINGLGFSANVAFVNYSDYATLKFAKDSTGRSIFADEIARLGEIELIPVSSNTLPQDKVLVMDDRYWNLFINSVSVKDGYGVQAITSGGSTTYVSDLEVNQRTLVFETYVKSYIPGAEVGSTCWGSVAAIKTAIGA